MNLCKALNVTTYKILCDVLSDDTTQELSEDISQVFSGCSADEVYLMLSVAEGLKNSLRLKKINLSRE